MIVATNEISVRRPASGDPTDAPTWTTIAAGVPAVIGAPSGADLVIGGRQELVDARLVCDTTDIRPGDQIDDATLGDSYDVVWARPRTGLGLDHTVAGLRRVTGAASG